MPLAGVRVLDLTVAWSGPYATMLLGDLGAEIIRVESMQYFPPATRGQVPRPSKALVRAMGQLGRRYVDLEPGARPWDRTASFNWHARNKLSMTVDLRREEGRRIFLELVAVSDALIENLSPGTMEKLGLGYEVLRRARPDFIVVSMPAFGNSGPYRDYRAFGANAEALCGVTWVRGYPDLDPSTTTGTFFMDVAGGTGVAFALLAALAQRRRTGRGQLIDFAQTENLLAMFPQPLLDVQLNGRVRRTLGNRHPSAAPQGAYPCAGEDNWVALSVRSDRQWQALCRALGRPDLAADRRFRTAVARKRNEAALDAPIAAWTRARSPQEAAGLLQEAGVPAGPVQKESDAYADPHLNARGFFVDLTHREAGRHRYPGVVWRQQRVPPRVRFPACCLGEHNEYVYRELLGYSEAEYRRLEEEQHIGDVFL